MTPDLEKLAGKAVENLKGPVREHLQRLINRAFNNLSPERPGPQFSIPADNTRDTDLIVSDGIENAVELILTLTARNREMEEALRRIIEIDQQERKTVTDVDSAGCSYAVTKVDGWCADVARRALTPATQDGETP